MNTSKTSLDEESHFNIDSDDQCSYKIYCFMESLGTCEYNQGFKKQINEYHFVDATKLGKSQS